MPAGHLLAGGEPHAAGAAHVGHQVLQQGNAGGAPAHEGVAGQHEAAVLRVHRRELLAPHLEHPARVGDRVGGAVDVAEERRVVEQPLHRHLGERPLGGWHVVRHVVAHQRAVVEEAVALEQVGGPHVDVPGGRAVAGRPHAQARGQDLDLLAHHPLLLLLVEETERLVDVAVGADLVARVADSPARVEVVLDRPARDEEAGPELQAIQQAEDPVHAHPRPEAALLQVAEAAPGLLGLAEEEAGLRVDVEREDGGGPLARRPRIPHRGHPDTQPPLGWRICPVR